MSKELTTLSTLAVEINLLNEQVEHHKNQAVVYAARTGEKLLLAKSQCKHGEFGNWLKENCKVSERYAQQFMKLATDMPQLLSNPNSSSFLGLKQAIELLSAPEEVKTEVTAKIEAGEDVTIKEIQRLKKEAAKAEESANLAKNELERLRREQQKAIQDGVTLELNKLETEMNKKRYQIEAYERDLNDLKKVKFELDADVGAIAIHKQAIKEVKNHLTFLTTSFADAFDTGVIPNEFTTEWKSIAFAFSQTHKQMIEFVNRKAPIESEALIGELVN